jgi:prevent-host-death family protein
VVFDSDPKTDAGTRTVVLPPHVLPFLAEHMASWAGEDWLLSAVTAGRCAVTQSARPSTALGTGSARQDSTFRISVTLARRSPTEISLLHLSQAGYTRGMSAVPARELRNNTAEILRRVEAGEEIEVLRDNRPVAKIIPLPWRRRWLPASEVIRELAELGPDTTGLAQELKDALTETTDDLPW